jgi:hypothetical protein
MGIFVGWIEPGKTGKPQSTQNFQYFVTKLED